MQNPFEALQLQLEAIQQQVSNLASTQDYLVATIQAKGNPPQLLTIDQAAELLNLSKHTLYAKVSKGTIPFSKMGKRLYFDTKQLLDYIASGKSKTVEEIVKETTKLIFTKS